MLSSPADPHDGIDVRVEIPQYEDINVPEQPGNLGHDDSVSDADSERNIIARHNLYARMFPPPVLRSPQPFAKLSVYSGSQSNFVQDSGTTFSAKDHGSIVSSSESIMPDGDALEKSWLRVVDKKAKISALRENLFKVRRQTRKARKEKDDVDNSFMSLLRPLLTTPSSTAQNTQAADLLGVGPNTDLDISRLKDLLGEMQETRYRCQALEVSLEAQEDDLDIAQEELDYLERLLINDARPGAPKPSEEAEVERDFMPEPLLGLDEEPVENYHPLYMRFMEALRDHNMADEEYHENLARKAEIEEDLHRLELRQNYEQGHMTYTRQLDTRDQEFLRDFEKEEKSSLDRLARLRDEANSLRDLCFEEGVVPRYAELSEMYDYYPCDFSIDMDQAIESDKSCDASSTGYTTATRFWVLLSNPFHLLEDEPVTATTALKKANTALAKDPDNVENKELRKAALKEFIIEHLIHDARPGDKGNFINRWALHKLRISPGEAELMYSSFTDETGLYIQDVHRWQHDVLYCWPRDEAARAPPEQYKGALSRVEASSEGSVWDSSLNSSDSILLSDQADHSQDPDTSSHTQDGEQTDIQDEDATDSGKIEVVPHVSSGETLESPQKQDTIQFGTLLAVPAEELQTLKPEAMVIAPSEKPKSSEPDTVHTILSARVQTFEPRLEPDLPLESPHSVDPGVVTATPAKEPSVHSDNWPTSTEHPLTKSEEKRVLAEEPKSL